MGPAARRCTVEAAGLVYARPSLDDILSSTDDAVDSEVVQHNSALAFVRPAEWRSHVFSVKDDLCTSPFLSFDGTDGTYYKYRAPVPDFSGHTVLHQKRQDIMVIASFPTFEHRFRVLSLDAFKGLNTRGLVFSGGFVTACLTTSVSEANAYSDSDIDIFLTVPSPRLATKVVSHLQGVLRHNVPDFDANFRTLRTPGVITLVPSAEYIGRGYRKIQIIMVLYDTPSDIVAHFDLDPVCVAYDLTDVYIAPRAMRSFWTGSTYATDALCASNAQRILKYCRRGFAVRFPDASYEYEPEDNEMEGRVLTVAKRLDEETSFVHSALLDLEPGHITAKNVYDLAERVRRGSHGQWLHSLTDFARLVALWNLVSDKVGLEEVLVRAIKGPYSAYGFYSEPQRECTNAATVCVDTESDVILDGLIASGFLSARVAERKIHDEERYVGNGTLACPTIQDACLKGGHLTVILPCGLAEKLEHHFGVNIVRLPYSQTVLDYYGIDLEACSWRLSKACIWGPSPHLREAPTYRLLKKVSQLTTWAMNRISYGAPFSSLRYSKTLEIMIDRDVEPWFNQEDQFVQWLCD
ncbi:hypothetical protein OC844_004823 [Tilletia horrida]|nr:hypothetical protein OC844_004823 [Tilletia horrida]